MIKATVKQIGNRYEIIGLEKPAFKDQFINNGKETYEMKYLFSFGGKSYKTLANAIKAIAKSGFEYIPVEAINLVCAYD